MMKFVLFANFGKRARTTLEMDFATDILHRSCITIKEIWNIFFPRPIEEIGVGNSAVKFKIVT
jgi:hypothetical protein